jgi:hypothetical protein
MLVEILPIVDSLLFPRARLAPHASRWEDAAAHEVAACITTDGPAYGLDDKYDALPALWFDQLQILHFAPAQRASTRASDRGRALPFGMLKQSNPQALSPEYHNAAQKRGIKALSERGAIDIAGSVGHGWRGRGGDQSRTVRSVLMRHRRCAGGYGCCVRSRPASAVVPVLQQRVCRSVCVGACRLLWRMWRSTCANRRVHDARCANAC